MAQLGKRKSIRLYCGEGLVDIRANLLHDPQQVKWTRLMFVKGEIFSLPSLLKRGYELYRVRGGIIEWDSASRTFKLVPKVPIDTLVATTNVTKNKFLWLVDETFVTTKTRDLGSISSNDM